jgi:hypothetical protein
LNDYYNNKREVRDYRFYSVPVEERENVRVFEDKEEIKKKNLALSAAVRQLCVIIALENMTTSQNITVYYTGQYLQ